MNPGPSGHGLKRALQNPSSSRPTLSTPVGCAGFSGKNSGAKTPKFMSLPSIHFVMKQKAGGERKMVVPRLEKKFLNLFTTGLNIDGKSKIRNLTQSSLHASTFSRSFWLLGAV